jgi:hypothetical protein
MMTVVNKKNKRIEIVLQKPLNKLACAYFTSKAAAAAYFSLPTLHLNNSPNHLPLAYRL